MKLHEKIRFLRAFKGLNQEQMAEKLNLSPNAYSKVEQGKTDITPDRLEKIAKIFEMTAEDIKTFEEKVSVIFFENKDSTVHNQGQYLYITESFEKERESHKAHLTDLQKQIASLEKQIEELQKFQQKLIEKLK